MKWPERQLKIGISSLNTPFGRRVESLAHRLHLPPSHYIEVTTFLRIPTFQPQSHEVQTSFDIGLED